MGMMIDGKWHRQSLSVPRSEGHFRRSEAACRNWVTADGSPGPSGVSGFAAEPGRYHLYVSYACPWAHRTLIFRKLKKLEDIVSVSVVHHFMGEDGWTFDTGDGATGDTVNGTQFLSEIYTKSDQSYSGRVTVPVLWDKENNVVVSNESSEIIRMFNTAFDQWADTSVDYYPAALRADIDEINAPIYRNINNGVYRCGFASTQPTYEEAFDDLFATLDELEIRLSNQRYLNGATQTEADWRLFPTLVRFDPVYFGHFKCNLRRVADYPNLSNYTRDLYQVDGVAETVNLLHIKNHYYASHETVNPTRIVPKGPQIDYSVPHDRDRF